MNSSSVLQLWRKSVGGNVQVQIVQVDVNPTMCVGFIRLSCIVMCLLLKMYEVFISSATYHVGFDGM